MALLFYPFQSMLAKDGKKLFYPRAKVIANVSTDQISGEVAGYSSLTSGDVKNTIDNLITVLTQHLRSSESVTLDGLGTFRIVMKSNGKGVETPEEVSPAQCSLYVRFMPSFKRNPDGTLSTRSLVTGVKCVPYAPNSVKPGNEAPGEETPGENTGGEPGDVDDDPLG